MRFERHQAAAVLFAQDRVGVRFALGGMQDAAVKLRGAESEGDAILAGDFIRGHVQEIPAKSSVCEAPVHNRAVYTAAGGVGNEPSGPLSQRRASSPGRW